MTEKCDMCEAEQAAPLQCLPKGAAFKRRLCAECYSQTFRALSALSRAALATLELEDIVSLTFRLEAGEVLLSSEWELHPDHAAHTCRVGVADGAVVSVRCLQCNGSALAPARLPPN